MTYNHVIYIFFISLPSQFLQVIKWPDFDIKLNAMNSYNLSVHIMSFKKSLYFFHNYNSFSCTPKFRFQLTCLLEKDCIYILYY